MKRRTFILSGLQFSAFVALGGTKMGHMFTPLQPIADGSTIPDVHKLFVNPPQSARPLTLWHWMNGLITREGITADLESFKEAGLAGVQVFLVGGSEMKIDDPNNPIMSERWRELHKFAIQECARLGLEFGTHNSPGWSSTGYPTITPEESMQKVIFSQTTVSGNGPSKIELATPKDVSNFYKDIAVYAIRTEAETVALNDIVDLTAHFSGNTVNWNVPQGNWTIYKPNNK